MGIYTPKQELNQLLDDKLRLSQEIQKNGKKIKELQKHQENLKFSQSQIDKKINILERQLGKLEISDHATLRLLERYYNFEEQIKKVKEIVIDEILQKTKDFEAINFSIGLDCGLEAVIRDNKIITIKPH